MEREARQVRVETCEEGVLLKQPRPMCDEDDEVVISVDQVDQVCEWIQEAAAEVRAKTSAG